ncbi:hypothetical protein PybrP1_005497 [[Pythium] brassicae (nom. inval.)]|nr:hypothetical protein PybrP1_005497 [[Pythium] brassicae (nom. inval.)]
MANALARIQEQRAQRLLDALQSDLRAQMRVDASDGVDRHENARARLKRRLERLADPTTRERVWSSTRAPEFEGRDVRALPKNRAFWAQVSDLPRWSKSALDAACQLLDLDGGPGGKKQELVARIQDWVHEPELRARRREQAQRERERDAVLASGRVFAFGNNFNGELGLGHRRGCDYPTEIEALRGCRVTQVISGFDANFAFALSADGRVFAWGGGGSALFDASLVCARTGGHVGFSTDSGRCFMWGRGDFGELGVDTQQRRELSSLKNNDVGDAKKKKNKVGPPVLVESLRNRQVARLSVGNCHSAAVTTDGALYTWGGCWSGQLGLGESKRAGVKDRRQQLFFPAPTIVEALHCKHEITRVSCGAVHTAVVSSAGQLFTFGCGDGGRLGLGASTGDSPHPQLVVALERDVVVDVCCANWHSLCLNRDDDGDLLRGGYVYAFGSGLHGQLGLGKQKVAALPTRVPDLYHRKVRCQAIAAASHHSIALSCERELFTWGRNSSGCLGRVVADGAPGAADPDVIERSATADFGVGPIVSIAAGDRFTLFATGPWEPRQEPEKGPFQFQEKLNRHSKFQS